MIQQEDPKELKDSLIEPDKTNQDIIFKLFSRMGDYGNYQKITLVFWVMACYLCGGLLFLVPYLYYEDPYQCPQDIVGQTCHDYVCSLPPSERHAFIPPHKTFQSMATQFGDYRCEGGMSARSLTQMLIFANAFCAQLILTLFGEQVGRKKFMVLGLCLGIVGTLVCAFANSLMMGAIGMFICNGGVDWVFVLSQLYISETVSEQWRHQFIVITHVSLDLGRMVNAMYFYWFRDWRVIFIYCYLIPTAILLLGIIYLVIDSPICLIRHNTAEEIKEKFLWVAKINNIQNPQLSEKQIQEVQQIQKIRQQQEEHGSKFTLLDLFKYPSLRLKSILTPILLALLLLVYNFPLLLISQFDFNIFISGMIIGASAIAAFPIAFFMVARLKRRMVALFVFATVLVCATILIFYWHPKKQGISQPISENIGVLVGFFIMGTVTAVEYSFFDVYLLELYPTQVRMLGTTFTFTAATTVLPTMGFIIDTCNQKDFSIMYVICALSIVALLISYKLPETYGLTPPDLIEELNERAKYAIEQHDAKHPHKRD